MQKIRTSSRLATVPASPIRKLVPYASYAKKRGIKVYHLNIGDPDIKTPKVMLDALRTWKINPISYAPSQGEPNFINAMKLYYHKLGFNFIENQNIQITSGGSEAISMALFATCEIGDEIITFEPFYTNYNSYSAVNGVKIIPVQTYPDDGFHLPKILEIEKKISKKTKAILYCNPNNPTGTVYTEKEISMLVNLCRKYHLYLIADEVYREFVYDGKRQVSILSYFKTIPNQAILLDSLSKRYSLCGARLGILISLNSEIMDGVLRLGQGRLSVGLIDQLVASKLTSVKKSYFNEVNAEYARRRDILYEGLTKIQGVELVKPEGAFYCIAKLPVKDADDFCKYLLTDFNLKGETIMLAPAAGFYKSQGLGKNEVRIAYVINTKDLKKSLLILKSALEKYNK